MRHAVACFRSRERETNFAGGGDSISEGTERRLRRRRSRGVVLSNIGAKEAKGGVGNAGRRGEERIICTLNVDMRRIHLLLFPLNNIKGIL